MYKKTTKNVTIYNYSSINDFISVANSNKDYDAVTSFNTDVKRQQWIFSERTECNSRKKTYNLLQAGRGLSSVRNLAKQYRDEFNNTQLNNLSDRFQSVKRVRKFNDFNGNLDFDRVMTGDPNYWERVQRDGQLQTVRIGVNYGMSHENSINSFSRIVALASILAEILENLGYAVEIYGTSLARPCDRAKKPKTRWECHSFPVKSANEPLDFERIHSLGLTGLSRDVQFRADHKETGGWNSYCEQAPQQVIQDCNIDLLVERSWITGNEIERIAKAVESI